MTQQETEDGAEVWEKWPVWKEEYEMELDRYLQQSPVFVREMEIENRTPEEAIPDIYSDVMHPWTNPTLGGVGSELQFAVAYGYKEALLDILKELEDAGVIDDRESLTSDQDA